MASQTNGNSATCSRAIEISNNKKHQCSAMLGLFEGNPVVTSYVHSVSMPWSRHFTLREQKEFGDQLQHYTDVIMTTMASQITSLTVVYSTVYSDADQRKHQSSASLAFLWGIHRDRWISRTKGQLRRKCFHLMTSSWEARGKSVIYNNHFCFINSIQISVLLSVAYVLVLSDFVM